MGEEGVEEGVCDICGRYESKKPRKRSRVIVWIINEGAVERGGADESDIYSLVVELDGGINEVA